MKKLLSFLAVSALLVCSCANNNSKTEDAKTINSAKALVESNVFLDATYDEVAPAAKAPAENNDLQQVKAALYRFYKHVTIEDGLYVCSLNTANEINVSETMFANMKADMDKLNAQICEQREKGVDVSLPEITEEYLNSLLD